ncbi:MAG: FtsQ-type POTRA domain-containing protein [Candidatus Abyssobacteria bacterium SURF_5]|uniref:FtsQ-type POTRA domain-containing protein n=1 Tax=Abyssobacteria bacterium (strain SURF_5) TaxID=2093360 RepID=A0A3A4PA43_ABYX5|nr:MAG: FtsQ-type POTRA domain-containing protein [Candidatus Abyssubacteria bacterium SURF_5]
MSSRAQKRRVFPSLSRIRAFLHRRDHRPVFAGKFFSGGTKVIQTARNKPQRRQKVKPRQRIIVAKKQKIVRAVSLSLKIAVAGCAVAVLGMTVSRFVGSSSRFSIKHIGVTGNTHVTAQTIIQQSGLKEGENIFRSVLADAAASIARIPRVHSVVVRRKLPDEIHIEIKERRPAAILLADELLVLDHEKKIIERYDPAARIDLPILTGKQLAQYTVGDVIESDGIDGALHIIDLMNELGMAKSIGISEINIDDPDDILLIAEQSGATIHLGTGDYPGKLWRLKKVTEEIQRHGRLKLASLERVDMRFETIVPAKFGS